MLSSLPWVTCEAMSIAINLLVFTAEAVVAEYAYMLPTAGKMLFERRNVPAVKLC